MDDPTIRSCDTTVQAADGTSESGFVWKEKNTVPGPISC